MQEGRVNRREGAWRSRGLTMMKCRREQKAGRVVNLAICRVTGPHPSSHRIPPHILCTEQREGCDGYTDH